MLDVDVAGVVGRAEPLRQVWIGLLREDLIGGMLVFLLSTEPDSLIWTLRKPTNTGPIHMTQYAFTSFSTRLTNFTCIPIHFLPLP